MKLSPVNSLIRACLAGGEVSHARLSPETWATLPDHARGHGVSALIAPRLKTTVPPEVRAALQQESLLAARANLALVAELHRQSELFREAGIPLLSFKGPVLMQRAWANPAARPSSDLDLLVRPEDVARAADLLASDGYIGRSIVDEALARRDYESPLRAPTERGGSAVDLHWDLSPAYMGFRLRADGLLDAAEELELQGQSVLALPRALELWAALVHGSRHLWYRWSWIAEAAQLVKKLDAREWEQFRGALRDGGNARMVLAGLEVTRRALDAPVPDDLAAQARADAAVQRAVRFMLGYLSGPLRKPSNSTDYLYCHWLLLTEPGARRDLARQAARMGTELPAMLFRPTAEDRAAVRLPGPLAVLYPVVRPVRLAGRFARRVRGGG